MVPNQQHDTDLLANIQVYNHTEIDTPFLTTPTPGAEMTADQAKFQTMTDEVMGNPSKNVADCEEPLRLLEDDLPTAGVEARNPERALFIT